MPSPNRNEKVTREKCGNQFTKPNLAHHKKRCSGGTLYCTQCPSFSTLSQDDLNCHIAKQHSAAGASKTYKCKLRLAEFPGFYALRQHKNAQHGTQIGFGASKIDVEDIVGDVDDQSLREELQSCRHFLVDSEIQKGRHSVFDFGVNNLTAQVIEEKLDRVLDKLNCVAKLNLALGFILKNIEDGKFRYFYAHEKNTLLEQSKLVSNKDDMAKLKEILKKTDVIESCTKERSNTKWRFFKLTNLTIFAALLRDIPMACKDAVLPESLLKNHTVNCLTYEQNTKTPYKDYLCLFRALALHLHGNERLEEETSNLFNFFLINITNLDPSKLQGLCMDDIPTVEDVVDINIFTYDIDLFDGAMVGELARRSIKKYEKNVQLIRYKSHICYLDNIHALFKALRCPTCDTYFQKTGNLERHLVRCSERVKHIYPKNVYQLRETPIDKLDSFNIQYTDDQKLFNNLAVFDFESICIPEEKFKNTETTTWIGKHVPISVSISSNLIAKPIFLCNSNPRDLVESFIDAVEGLATQSKAQMKLKFLEVETAIKSKLTRTLESLIERRCRNQRVFEFEDHCFEDDNEEKDASTQLLQMQKNQLIELQEHLERYCNVLPVFGFRSAKYDINLIKSYLLPILINERNMEPTVIKKGNQFVSCKFGDVQLLDIMNFLGAATSLDSFLKAYKTSETKGFFPYEWFDCPQKMNISELPPYDAFFSKLRNVNPLEKDYSDYRKLLSSGFKTEEALSKMKFSKPPPSGEENYQYLLDIWNHENMCTFKDFLLWYNNKDVVPTLEAMQKMLAFYHKKGIYVLKLGCTLPNLANICLHKTTSAKFYAFTETDKDLLQKIRENMVGGPFIVFTRKAVVDGTFIRNSGNTCKSIVRIDASQLYPYSMCQPMPTELYTRWEYDTESNRFKPQQNKSRNFENMVMSYFQRQRPDCKIESFYTTGTQKKIDCCKVDGCCAHCNTVFEAMGCFYHYCSCQEARPFLTEEDIERGNKKREMDQMRKQYIREKGYNVVEMWECEWWNLYKTTTCVKEHLRQSFPYKRSLREESLLEQIRSGNLFGYVQCDIEVPEELKGNFPNFPLIFKNTNVDGHDIGLLMKDYAEKEGLLSQPRKMLISSYFLEIGTLII